MINDDKKNMMMFVVCLYVFFVVSLSIVFFPFFISHLLYLSLLDEGLPTTIYIHHITCNFTSIVNQRRAKCQIRIVANGTLMVIKKSNNKPQHNIHYHKCTKMVFFFSRSSSGGECPMLIM